MEKKLTEEQLETAYREIEIHQKGFPQFEFCPYYDRQLQKITILIDGSDYVNDRYKGTKRYKKIDIQWQKKETK